MLSYSYMASRNILQHIQHHHSRSIFCLRPKLCLLERILWLIIHSQPYLLLLLRGHMLDPDLLCVALHELSDKPWIPELRCNAQIFAAAHQGVGLAALGGRWDTFRGEVLLFAAGD